MGVKGLWDLIRPAGVHTTLQALAREAVESGRGSFKLGIDASLWIFHSRDVRGGENPLIRTVFFRILALLQHPVSPVFVFDGPNRPAFKRGNRTGGHFGTRDEDSTKFKKLLDTWGIPWLQAPGEAEAELAILNRAGRIDAVLSDDADSFIFGARAVLRNNSPELSGSRAAASNQGSSKDVHSRDYVLYRLEDIVRLFTSEESNLQTEEDCHLAMVLLALLSGGDYNPQGIASMGPNIAMGLARAGHSRPLAHFLEGAEQFARQLPIWRQELVEELRHNLSGYIGRRYKVLAEKLAAIDAQTLLNQLPLKEYLRPTVTPAEEQEVKWRRLDEPGAAVLGRGTVTGAAAACEHFFEWGTPDLVVKRFAATHSVFSANVVTSALTSEVLSESAVLRVHDVKPSKMDTGHRDVVVDCQWTTYASYCRSVMVGRRPDPSTLPPEERTRLGLVEVARPTAAQPAVETSRIKLPEYLVKKAWQSALDEYEKDKAERASAKTKKGKPKPKAKPKTKSTETGSMNIRDFMTQFPPSQAMSSQTAPAFRSDSPLAENTSTSIEVTSSPVPSIFSESPPPIRRQSVPSPVPTSPSPPPVDISSSLSPTPLQRRQSRSPVPTSPSPPPVETSLSPSPPPSPRRPDQPRLFFTDSEGSEPETELASKPLPKPVQAQVPEPEPESDHDESVVLIEPPAAHAPVAPLSPSKRSRRAGSKNGSSRSTTPMPKRSANSFARAGSVGVGTKDDPISLSDSDDEDVFPMLRAAPSRSTRSTSVPKNRSAKPTSAATKPRSRAAATKSPPKPKSGRKATENATPLGASVAPTGQQTLLQGFFKPTAKVTAPKPAKPRREKKEKYTVEEKDGVEVYRFL